MATEATPLLATTTAPVPSPSTWRETLSFAARYLVPPRSDPQSYALILGAVMATLAVAPARLLPELLAQRAVDAVFGGAADPARGAGVAARLLLLALAARVGAGAVDAAGHVARRLACARLQKRVKVDVFAHLHELELAWHLGKRNGEVLKNMSRGSVAVVSLAKTAVFEVAPVFWELALVGALFVHIGVPRVGLVVMVSVGVFLVYTAKATGVRMRMWRGMNEKSNALRDCQSESLGNAETVISWGSTGREVAKFCRLAAENAAAACNMQLTFVGLNVGSCLIKDGGIFLALLVVAHASQETGDGRLSPGQFLLVNSLASKLYWPFLHLTYQWTSLTKAMTDLENLVVVWKRAPAIVDCEDAVELPGKGGGEVRFENVSFRYKGDAESNEKGGGVTGVSFVVPAGETLALVGETGSGKTTIARLLLRMFECQSGAVLVNGHDVRRVGQKSLREYIGVVAQQTVLFNDTLLYNFRYGKGDATKEEAMAAAEVAALADFIGEQPKGLDTVVGERGVKLSGGQLSRCGIARCVLKQPSIVVLDESTAALDVVSERAVQRGLADVCRGRTTIIIAHRLATVMHANNIIVLEQGVIKEMGTHSKLVGLGGIYADMWARQTGTSPTKSESGVVIEDSTVKA
jgi:ATP-binding cassette, subfamily B, heavy metal transporter